MEPTGLSSIKQSKYYQLKKSNEMKNITIKVIWTLLIIFTHSTITNAQRGIGTNNPNPAAALDIVSTNKGVLVPRIALTDALAASPLSAHVAGMLIYNTATVASAGPIEGVTPGFYFNNGTRWVRVAPEIYIPIDKSGTIVSNGASTDVATEDFVFGSSSLDDIVGTNDNSRMFFDKSKGAFRVGNPTGNQFDDANVGISSFASGSATASGAYSVAMGLVPEATNTGSVALGTFSRATAFHSVAIGVGTHSGSARQVSVGAYNTEVTGNLTSFISTDRLFVVGNGSSPAARNDALVILKNGSATFGGTFMEAGELTLRHGLKVDGVTELDAWINIGSRTSPPSGSLRALGSVYYDSVLQKLRVYTEAFGTGSAGWEDLNDSSADVRLVGTNNHITSDAGFGGTGTTAGSGADNIAIGRASGNSLGTGSSRNVLLGAGAGESTTNNSFNNVFIGYQAGQANLFGDNNIVIGDDIDVSATNVSNELNIGGIIFGEGVNNVSGTAISSGRIGIGTAAHATDRLYVGGNLRTAGFITAEVGGSSIPDYVFEKYYEGKSKLKESYEFKTLEEVEAFIKLNKHLPGVMGMKDLEITKEGKYMVNLSKLSNQTLEKVEELYLHTIAQQKKINALNEENELLKSRLEKIEKALGIKKGN